MKRSIFLLLLLPFVFAACQNPTGADYVPPPSYEPEPTPPQPLPPPPPVYVAQDIAALHRNILGVKAAYGFIRSPHWFPDRGAPTYVYPISIDSYRAISAYLQGFHANRTVATFPPFTISAIAVELLSITTHSLTLVKHTSYGASRTTQYIVPRYVRL